MAFPNVVAIKRPLVKNQIIKDLNWLAGFTSAEGCFMVKIRVSHSVKIGFQVILIFQITQHYRDALLMKSLESYLGCGGYFPRTNKNFGEFLVAKFKDLTDIIIPFFDKYPIIGVKFKDFYDFKRAAELMKNGAHLTSEGLEKIREIKIGMNKGR